MLLNTKTLLEKADKATLYGEACAVHPYSNYDLPLEFKEKEISYWFNPSYVVELDNVELCGPIAVCFWNEQVVLDVAYFGRMDTWDRNRTYFNQAVKSRNIYKPTHLDEACSLLGVWSGNYFHWTLEILPMLEGIPKDTLLLLEHNPRPWVFESLEYLGYKNLLPIESMYYTVGKLFVPTVRRRDGRTSPDSIEYLQRMTKDIEPGPYEKIYISRKDATKRQLTNEREVMKFLAGHGFTPVVFSGFDWKKQVSIIKGVSTVIAPHGAGLVNLVYNENQPAIIELATPEYLNPCFYTMAAAMGSQYDLIVGNPVAGENIYVDIGELEKKL